MNNQSNMDLRNAFTVAWSDLKEATDANIVKPGQSVLADGLGLVSRLSNYAWMKAETGSWFNNVARKIYHKVTEWQEALKAASQKPSRTTHLKSDVRLLGNELGRVIKEKFLFAVDVISRTFGTKTMPQQIPAKPLPLPPLKKVAELEQTLARLESERHAEDRDGFHERIFQTSKDLYQLRRALPKKELAKDHPLRIELRRAEKRLEELNPHLPRVRDIVKAKELLKATLAETVSALCEKGEMTSDDIERDKALFSLSTDQEAKALYAKRVLKSGRTGFHLSTVTGIERSWQELKGTTEGVTREFNEAGIMRHVVFLPNEGEVYLKEQNLKPGSFKVASLATPFFEVKKQEQRGEIAILQPLDDSLDEKASAEESPASGSIVILDVEQVKLEAADGFAAQERKRRGEKQQEFEREANFCRELGKLPGVWPTHKVCTVDGEIAIFQKAAGYRSGQNERVIDLDGMQDSLKLGKLSIDEQKRYLDMLDGALEGVQSLHAKGIIHRDLKLANMLVSKDGRGYVSDLGTVVRREGDPEKKIAIGSPSFMSPEVGVIAHLKDESTAWKEVDTSADIWSLGVILWELATGKDAHEHPSIQLTSEYVTDKNVARGTALLAPVNPDEIENEKDREDAESVKKIYQNGYQEPQVGTLAHLVWRCTRPNPAERPAIGEVREFYRAWSQLAKERLDRGAAQSIKDCFIVEVQQFPLKNSLEKSPSP